MTLTQDALDGLTNYTWPGNVRQLRNEIERVVAYASDGARISIDDLSPEVKGGGRTRAVAARAISTNGTRGYGERTNGHRETGYEDIDSTVKLKEATAALERRLIEASLLRNKNNLSRTALELGLSRRGLRLKLAQLGIQREEGF
jgi:DNA-binding NtrC family response regulator